MHDIQKIRDIISETLTGSEHISQETAQALTAELTSAFIHANAEEAEKAANPHTHTGETCQHDCANCTCGNNDDKNPTWGSTR